MTQCFGQGEKKGEEKKAGGGGRATKVTPHRPAEHKNFGKVLTSFTLHR